jgi:hypothetical protein
MKIGHYAVATAGVFALGILAAAAHDLPQRVSGYEYFPGTPCTINGQSATCDVQFAGWTGGNGPVPTGWTAFPGNNQGMWTASADYKGKPKLGGQVMLLGGSFHLLFNDGHVVLGKVTSGTIAWPAAGQSSTCGTNVAVISMNVTYRAGATGTGRFRGCLHDLPTGSVIPPKIWGRLQ